MKKTFAIFVCLVVSLLLPVSAVAQRHCSPVTGTIQADFDFGALAWIGEASFTINGETLQATSITTNTGVSKGGPTTTDMTWIGTETTALTFEDGSTMDLLTNFRTVHNDDIARFYVIENSDIANGTETFEGVFGRLTSHGSFAFFHWEGEFHGNICGL